MDKTHRAAVVVIPPEAIWEPIQAIRRAHDRRMARWMPHVTLLYPFLGEGEQEAAVARLSSVAERVSPFPVRLARFETFSHGPGQYTVWLAPEPGEHLVALQAALQGAFLECDDVSRQAGGFTPHLSVGQVSGDVRRAALLRDLRRGWEPLEFEVDAFSLIVRAGDEPFRVARRFPLRA
jgi:2'-5' RNA ligase